MGKHYYQLSLDERERISVLKAEGRGPSEIGRLLERDRKTIERELVRNGPPVRQGYYLPHKAHERAKVRKQAAESIESRIYPIVSALQNDQRLRISGTSSGIGKQMRWCRGQTRWPLRCW